jgi:hypothetical protein
LIEFLAGGRHLTNWQTTIAAAQTHSTGWLYSRKWKLFAERGASGTAVTGVFAIVNGAPLPFFLVVALALCAYTAKILSESDSH